MKWLRVASQKNESPDAPLTVEAKGERAKIRELRQRLEKEDKASEIKALSDAIDALESRLEKDKASREKRKQEKLEKAKNKPAEPAPVADTAKPASAAVTAAPRRAPAETEDESNIELDMEHLDEHTDTLNEVDDDADLINPMRVAPGDIMNVDLPSQAGPMSIEVDMTGDGPQIMSVKLNGKEVSEEDLAALIADEEFMADVEHAAIAKMHGENPEPMPEEEGAPMHDHEMEAVPAALLGQMTAFAEVISAGEYEGDPKLILQLQAQLEDLGARYPKSAGQIGELYHALDQGYRELMENARPVFAADDSDADEADDKGDDDKKDDAPKSEEKKDDAPKKDGPPKSEKKDAPAAPKKDAPAKKPAAPKHDESKDIADADEAIEILRDLIDKEKGDMEGGAHVSELEQALKLLEKFKGEEHAEEGDADMFKSKPMPGAGPKPPMPGGAPGKVMPMKMEILPPAGGPAKGPMPAGPAPMKPMSAWLDTSVAGFPVGARVWRAEQTGSMEYVGDESGRVVASENGMVIVDWGDEIPTENLPGDLTLVQAAADEAEVFEPAPDLSAVADEQDFEQRTADEEASAILSSLSLKDMLSKAAEDAVDPDAIVHLASGKIGKFIATASDGKVMINIGGKEMTVYAYEIATANNTGEGLF